MNNVHTLPTPHPKAVEASSKKQAIATLRQDQKQYIKDAMDAGGFKFVVIAPNAHTTGITVCYKQTGFDVCQVSTAIHNPRDKVVPVLGKFEAINRILAGNSIMLKKPTSFTFDEYLRMVFTIAGVR